MKMRNLFLLSLPILLSVSACSNMQSEARYPTGADRSSTNGNIYENPKSVFGEKKLKALFDNDSEQAQSEEIQHIMQAKITLMDAMKIAEKVTQGQATEGVLEDSSSDIVHYKVDILKDGKLLDVVVDGITGKVLKVYADKED